MQYEKVTKLTLRGDMPASISSSINGANFNTVGFNIDFILQRRPGLAVELLKLYQEANQIKLEDPQPPNEDYGQALEEWGKIMGAAFGEKKRS